MYLPGKAVDDGPSTYAPASHVKDPERELGSWLLSGLAPATTAIWEVNQKMENLFLCHSAFQTIFLIYKQYLL